MLNVSVCHTKVHLKITCENFAILLSRYKLSGLEF